MTNYALHILWEVKWIKADRRNTGIVTFCTVRVVSHHLQQIRDITKVDDDDQGPTKIDRTTEEGQYQYASIIPILNSNPSEALSLETLKRLADAPVYELRLA